MFTLIGKVEIPYSNQSSSFLPQPCGTLININNVHLDWQGGDSLLKPIFKSGTLININNVHLDWQGGDSLLKPIFKSGTLKSTMFLKIGLSRESPPCQSR